MTKTPKLDVNQRIAVARGAAFRKMREAKGITQGELAKAVGTSQQTIDRIERGEVVFSRFGHAIAARLGFKDANASVEKLEREIRTLRETEMRNAIDAGGLVQPSQEVEGSLLPVHALLPGEEGYRISDDPVDYILRTFPVHMAPAAYGVIVPDSSMVPVFRPGDIVLVNPHLPPVEPADVVLWRKSEGSREGIIRTLEAVSPREWMTRAWDASRTEALRRSEWKAEVIVARIARAR